MKLYLVSGGTVSFRITGTGTLEKVFQIIMLTAFLPGVYLAKTTSTRG